MTARKKTNGMDLELETSSPIELAMFRESMRPMGSGPLGMMRIAYELCNKLAEAKGWDLDSVLPEALELREERFKQQEEERAREHEAARQADLAKRTANYIKKHGHAPPTQADRDSALAKLTPMERKALGL